MLEVCEIAVAGRPEGAIEMMMRSTLKKIIPQRYHLPLSYYKHKFQRGLEPEMALLPELTGTGKRAIDVGANSGFYTYALSKLFAKVEAFEPVPEYFRMLSVHPQRNVTLHNVALSDRAGSLQIHVPRGEDFGQSPSFVDFGYDAARVEVALKTLDEYRFDDVSFIKIDVEGYESEVLVGATQTIQRTHPILLIEIEQRHIQRPIDEVLRHIVDLGYHGFFYKDARLVDLATFSYEKDQKPFLANVSDKNYINNFIFKPS